MAAVEEDRVIATKVGVFTLRQTSADISFEIANPQGGIWCTAMSVGGQITNSVWQQVAGFYDGGTIGVVINGSIRDSSPCTVGPLPSDDQEELHIGGLRDGAGTVLEPYIGKIDELSKTKDQEPMTITLCALAI